jgi:hypothetical protein
MTPGTKKIALIIAESARASINTLTKTLQDTNASDAACNESLEVVSSLLAEDAKRLQELCTK